jgi:citrate lyase subunit gamma (acyl carrier protein)
MEFSSKAVTAGSSDKNDVKITLEIGKSGRQIEIQSKVKKKFGEAIYEDVITMLEEYHLENVHVLVEDLGALDYVIKARVETAIKRAMMNRGDMY